MLKSVKKNARKIAGAAVALALGTVVLAGCSGGSASSSAAASGSASAASEGSSAAASASAEAAAGDEVTHILVGTAGSPAPYGWVNEDGTLGGYDQAIIHEIDDRLPQYEFEFEITEFPSIFSGIDSGRYQMGANNFSKTAEREEKYYFDTESYIYNTMAIIFKAGRDDIQGPADLGGKRATTEATGVTFQLFLEAYNEANPDNPIDITYSEIDMLGQLNQIVNGESDFSVNEVALLNYYKQEFGLDLDYVVLDEKDAYDLLNLESYHIYPKTPEGEALRDAVSGALADMKADGTIARLSEEYFGFDMYEGR